MKRNNPAYALFCTVVCILYAVFLSSCHDESAATVSGSGTAALIPQDSRQIWLYIPDTAAFSNIPSWQYTYDNADVAVINISVIKNLDAAGLKKLTDAVNSSDLQLAVECSGLVSVFGTDTFHNAEKSMAYNSVNHTQKGEYTILSALIESGCEIDYLIFKNPVLNAIYPNADHKTQDNRFMTIAEAVSQTVEAMKCWREHLPQIKFLLYTDFYNYGWKGETAYDLVYNSTLGAGDYYYELTMASEAAKDAGIPLFGLVVNNPYDYAMGRHISSTETAETPSRIDWMTRLCDLENECNNRGINFILTLNCDASGKNGSDEKYYNDLLRYKNKYSEAGGTPEVYIVKGGTLSPSDIIPETKEFSLTYDASKFIADVKYGEEISLSLSTKAAVDVPENLTLIREWTFDKDSGGWSNTNNISDFYIENGWLGVISSGGDPFFTSEDELKLDTADCDYLYIKYMNISSPSDRMEFFFSTYDSTGMDEIKTIKFSVDAISEDDTWSEIYIPLGQCDAWQGLLKQMRLDPGMASGEFRFDCIALYKQG